MRSLDVLVGQFKFDVQNTSGSPDQIPTDKTTMYIAYRKPTLITELLPLLRFSRTKVGDFNVTLYGYDFKTTEQAETLVKIGAMP